MAGAELSNANPHSASEPSKEITWTSTKPSPGKYVKAVDLKGREVTVVVASIEFESINAASDRKLVMHFQGKERGISIQQDQRQPDRPHVRPRYR